MRMLNRGTGLSRRRSRRRSAGDLRWGDECSCQGEEGEGDGEGEGEGGGQGEGEGHGDSLVYVVVSRRRLLARSEAERRNRQSTEGGKGIEAFEAAAMRGKGGRNT